MSKSNVNLPSHSPLAVMPAANEGFNPAPGDGLRDVSVLSCSVEANPFPHPDAKGQDAFEARMSELPGLVAYGPTESEARRLWRELTLRELESASQERRRQLDAVRAYVQFNHRITVDEKVQITRRATDAGQKVRQFVLNQCLRAPVWTPPTTMPADQKEQLWRSVAKVASDRKAAEPTNLEGSA